MKYLFASMFVVMGLATPHAEAGRPGRGWSAPKPVIRRPLRPPVIAPQPRPDPKDPWFPRPFPMVHCRNELKLFAMPSCYDSKRI